MHFFKGLGLILLFACGLTVGYFLAAFEGRRCRQAEGFLALLRHIRLQIDCFSQPMGQILSTVDVRVRRHCGAPDHATDFPALLQGTTLLLPEEGRLLLQDFSDTLGSSYREEQLRCCDYYITRFLPLCERMRDELPKRLRLAWLLPTAAAGTLILLLL